MPVWKETLNVSAHWAASRGGDDTSASALVDCVIRWLEKRLAKDPCDGELEEIVEAFKALKKARETKAKSWTMTLRNRFDKIWDQLYDWADTNRVWVKTF